MPTVQISVINICRIDISVARFYSVSQKNPPWGFLAFFSQRLGIFWPNFTCYTFLSILDYILLFIYLQLWRSCTLLSVTTQFKMSTIGWNARWHFLTFFPNGWEFLVQILHTHYRFLSMLDCKFLFSYLLSATTRVHFGRWWTFWAYYGGRLIWHNFADNWTKISSQV